MPDPTLTDALEEAYASAPAARPIIHTMSIFYTGLGDEVYLYQGFDGDRVTAEGVPMKNFRLESPSRYHSGQVVEFTCLPFDVRLPNVNSQGPAKGQLIFDGASGEIAQHMLAAIGNGVSVEVTYRAYLAGLELDGPQNLPPIVFGLENVSVNALQVRGDITLPNLTNKRFPSETYTSTKFPALRR